jgi:hypothetical protein
MAKKIVYLVPIELYFSVKLKVLAAGNMNSISYSMSSGLFVLDVCDRNIECTNDVKTTKPA